MENFYSIPAVWTHFFYAEPHNAEMYFRFMPWERRYRRWLYSPSPGSIGRHTRLWIKSWLWATTVATFMLRRKHSTTVLRRAPKMGAKTANRVLLGRICLNMWNTRWAPTNGLNG